MPIIAIDLGTTNSRVALWNNGRIQLMKNEMGNRTTPSCVAFTGTERLLGDAAKSQAAMNAKNTVYEAKRLMGRKYSDPHVTNDMGKWSFTICKGPNHYPLFKVEFLKKRTLFTPEEVQSMLLSKMKEIAEKTLKETITDAVITVPAFFSSAQRQATKDAGKIAGLNVVRLVSETTAAAVAYGFENKIKGKQTIFVYHLGGGTFDVSIIKIRDGCRYDVLAVGGDSALGGIDFDNQLVEYFSNEFERKNRVKISKNSRALCRLRTACQNMKCILSTNTEAFIEIDNLCENIDFYSKITRSCFEDLCKDLFARTFTGTEQVLKDAQLDKSQIDEVFLIGGSTRMPKILNWHENFFGKEKMNFTINAEEIVLCGAAMLAEVNCSSEMLVHDVSPRPIFLFETAGENIVNIFGKHACLPSAIDFPTQTKSDNETSMYVKIYEGYKNQGFCENYSITDIPPASRGMIKMQLNFKLDLDGIFTFSAEIVSHRKLGKLNVSLWSERITNYDMQRMLIATEQYFEIDEVNKQRKATRVELEEFIITIAQNLASITLTTPQIENFKKYCAKELDWLDCHHDGDASTFKNRLKDLKDRFKEISDDKKRELARPQLEDYILKPNQLLKKSTLTKDKIKIMEKYSTKQQECLKTNQDANVDTLATRFENLQSRLHVISNEEYPASGSVSKLKSYFELMEKRM